MRALYGYFLALVVVCLAGALVVQTGAQLPSLSTVGAITGGHCAGFASPTQLQDTGATCGTNGVVTVNGIILPGSISGQTTITPGALGSLVLTPQAGQQIIANGAGLAVGTAGSYAGNIILEGATSGAVQITSASATPSGTVQVPNGNGVLATTAVVAVLGTRITGVNFNAANSDNAIAVPMPPGIARWLINTVRVNNCSAPVTTATAGLFTAAGGGGLAIANLQAVNVTATAADTNGNAQPLTVNNAGTLAYTDTTVYFRIGTAAGSAVTCDVVFAWAPQS